VIGHSRAVTVDRLVYVVPDVYARLPIADRYAVARLIGQVSRANTGPNGPLTTMLLGPGRWGTTTPSLGVPASFSEINRVSVLCEIVAMREDLIPDVSLGTHYFSDLVEMDILYLALFPGRDGNRLSPAFFTRAPNRLTDLAPDAGAWAEVVRVIDPADLGAGELIINANTIKQRVVCYLDRAPAGPARPQA
jgi:hypothetical protein